MALYTSTIPNGRGSRRQLLIPRSRLLQFHGAREENVVLQVNVLVQIPLQIGQLGVEGPEGIAGVFRRGVSLSQFPQIG